MTRNLMHLLTAAQISDPENLPTGIADAPADGALYARRDGAWSAVGATLVDEVSLAPYAAAGVTPKLVADLTSEVYASAGRRATFSSLFDAYGRIGLATMRDSSGALVWCPHNLVVQSASPAPQYLAVQPGVAYTVEMTGGGTVTVSGAATGSATEGSPAAITASTNTLTLTPSGDVSCMWAYPSDLSGMGEVPLDERARADLATYLPTSSTARYLPRRGHHIYEPSDRVYQIEEPRHVKGTDAWHPHNEITQEPDRNFNCTVTQNATTAPDGTEEAQSVVPISETSRKALRWFVSGEYVQQTAFYVKSNGWQFVQLGYSVGAARNTCFDIVNGTIADAATVDVVGEHSITDVGDGWYEIRYGVRDGPDDLLFNFCDTGDAIDVTADTTGNGIDGIYLWGGHVYRDDQGGMVDVPIEERARSDLTTYVPTTTWPRYLPLVDGSEWLNRGMLIETEARTNLLFNSAALSTQDVTVAAVPHTLSFTDTGSITLSGAHTATLAGTGDGVQSRVHLTFTPTAGTLTITVTGTVENAQLEEGATPSSYIPTTDSAATRSADQFTIAAANMPYSATGMSGAFTCRSTYADTDNAAEQTLFDWRVDADNRITLTLDTAGANTGAMTLTVLNGGTSVSVSATEQLTAGVDVPARVAWRVTPSEINLAVFGVVETAVANTAGVPDLSAADASVFEDFNGIADRVLLWSSDIGDSGLDEASRYRTVANNPLLADPAKTVEIVPDQVVGKRTSLYPSANTVFDARNKPHESGSQPLADYYRPINMRLAQAGAGMSGLKVFGVQSRDLSWADMKTDYDGDALWVEPQGGNTDPPNPLIVENAWIDNVEDSAGHNPDGPPEEVGYTIWRHSYFRYIRDDFENDRCMRLDIIDCLVDGTHTFYSGNVGSGSGSCPTNQEVNITGCVVHLKPMPYDGDKGGSPTRKGSVVDGKAHGRLFKLSSGHGPINCKDCVFLVPRMSIVGLDALEIPAGEHSNNIIVWLGGGDYPGTIAAGFAVTNDIKVFERARRDWLLRHGGFDMTRDFSGDDFPWLHK